MTAFARLLAIVFIAISSTAYAADKERTVADKPVAAAADAKCEHGVKKSICARCNPKLEPVFRAKNDWCEEHKRPESQCAICHPELKKQGIK